MRAKCSAGPGRSSKQSSGPPGTPSKKRMSQFPVTVYAGIMNSSPTPGTMLNRTAILSGCSGRGRTPWA